VISIGDATVILSNKLWDTMAGVLLVREAGGTVPDRDESDHTADSAVTIAVCAGLRRDIMANLQRAYADA
jgi:myo-inositol-1(or 4)-monophosphatase